MAVNTPSDSAKTIVVNGSGTVFSPLNVFGAQPTQIVADGLPGVFYVSTGGIPQIYRTSGSGGTWAPVTIVSDDKTFGLDGISVVTHLATSGFPGEIAARTDAWLYYSRDFGVTWTRMPVAFVNCSGLYWSHPSADGALSMLLFASGDNPTMAYASMPTSNIPIAPTRFTNMTVSYRASVNDPIAIANGSDAGIVAVGATTSSSSPSRTAGDIKLYRVSSAPNANTEVTVTLNNANTPGVVPTVATDGATPLAASDMVTIRLGGPIEYIWLGPFWGQPSTSAVSAPGTLLVYSVNSSDTASGASMTHCSLGAQISSCFATQITTFRDQSDLPVPGTFLASSGTTACGATRAANVPATVSPLGESGALGACLLFQNQHTQTRTLEVRQVNGIPSVPSMVFDAGYNGSTDTVVMTGDGSRGPVKSARPGANSTEGLNRPFFPAWPTYAAPGPGASTGGLSINGLLSHSVYYGADRRGHVDDRLRPRRRLGGCRQELVRHSGTGRQCRRVVECRRQQQPMVHGGGQ